MTLPVFGKKGAARALALAGVLVLAACGAREPGGYGLFAYGCADGAVLADQDWDKAETVAMSVRHGEYEPMVVGLALNKAYALTIENRDDFARRFDAPGFFEAVVLMDVQVGDARPVPTTCIAGLGLPPHTTVTVRFVTGRDGHFRFEDSGLLTALTGQAFGVIRID